MAKQIDLEDLIPATGEFKLEATGETVHTLRPITLQDQVWINDKFGGPEELKKILEGTKLKELCQLIYHQLVDKRHFPSVVEEQINDEGDSVTRKLTGPEMLASSIVSKKEQLNVYKALLKTIGVSEPMLEDALGDSKKKDLEPLQAPLVGEKSLTP
jgi:hypothetical protein